MKKKIFAIYALIGAMAASPIFTSCVDSEETPSVEALRNAKAEELKAIADLNNAQAASKTAIAAADAALLNAQAEAQKAQKKYNEARIAWYETQNESEKAALEVDIKQAEADLARIQGEIDAQAINVQAALMYTQKQLLEAQKALEKATKDYEAYEKNKIQQLASNYSQAVNDLIFYQQLLAVEKSKLVKLESGLLDAKKALEETIAENNNTINLNNIAINVLKQYTNYTEDIDALKQQLDVAYNNYDLAYDKYNSAWTKTNEAWASMDATAKSEAEMAILSDDFYTLVVRKEIYDAENEVWHSTAPASDYIYFSEEEWNYSYVLEYEKDGDKYSYSYGDSLSIKYELSADIRQIELAVDNATADLKEYIKTLNETIKADKTSYTAAVAATTAAKKAWDEAAEADKPAKKADYDNALYTELQLKQAIEDNETLVAELTAEVAVYEKSLDIVKNADKYYDALMAKVKAYNDADKAMYTDFLEAWKLEIDSIIVYNEALAEYRAIYNVYYDLDENYDGETEITGAESISNVIKEIEAENEELLAEIEEAKKLLTNYDGYDMPYEVAIEFQKQKVAAREAQVAAYEVKVKDAKEALDAAMPAEEETPAE